MIDLTPAGRFARRGVAKQFDDFASGLGGHDLLEFRTQPPPMAIQFERQLLLVEGDVADNPPAASTTTATSVAAAINFAADCAPRSPSDSFGDLNICTRANILQQPMVLHCGALSCQSSYWSRTRYRAELMFCARRGIVPHQIGRTEPARPGNPHALASCLRRRARLVSFGAVCGRSSTSAVPVRA